VWRSGFHILEWIVSTSKKDVISHHRFVPLLGIKFNCGLHQIGLIMRLLD
jgi:hypothetical protein